ncbi:MAG TPA: helix-turn-helix domain-containing protein [Stellaceae bacterium]|nr:helix-turn-helix domain-containing protein [Stellaceae bacterium]
MVSHVTTANSGPGRFTGLLAARGLGTEASNRLTALASRQRKEAAEILFSEGDNAENVYEVVSGTLRLYKLLPDGRRQITGFLSAGDLLGLSADEAYLYSAEAITEVTLCRYKRSAFERLIDEVPGFARRLLAVTSRELRVAQDQMLLLGRKSAVEKVASFLLLLAERQGEDRDMIEVPMTRTDIADYLGLTIETVSRSLSRLKQEEIIALPQATRVAIYDRDRLEDLAAGDADTHAW